MNSFEIEKQFKKDFGMTLGQATRLNENRKKKSDEIFALKLALNGFDIITGGKAELTEDDKAAIKSRLHQLNITD